MVRRYAAGGSWLAGLPVTPHLHRSIMAASHSPLLARLYALIEEARHGQTWGDMKRRSASRERQRLYQNDHRELVAALRAAGVPDEVIHFELFEASHMAIDYRYPLSLAWLCQRIAP